MALILVVDDDSSVLQWMCRAIGGEGHQVFEATSVEDALRLAKRYEFQLAVLDFRLPDGNGCSLFRDLRLRSPQIAGLLVTGFATTSLSFDSGKLGFAGILEKPLTFRALIDAINEALLTTQPAPTPSFRLPSLERLAKAIASVCDDESDFAGWRNGADESACHAARFASCVMRQE